mmetsp:Transcript_52860/g.148330  ORF Transcript_52860/g.148330 Transcript_52860/m.148330 type:complete len:273 (-) Transcript_52860:6-824(-)
MPVKKFIAISNDQNTGVIQAVTYNIPVNSTSHAKTYGRTVRSKNRTIKLAQLYIMWKREFGFIANLLARMLACCNSSSSLSCRHRAELMLLLVNLRIALGICTSSSLNSVRIFKVFGQPRGSEEATKRCVLGVMTACESSELALLISGHLLLDASDRDDASIRNTRGVRRRSDLLENPPTVEILSKSPGGSSRCIADRPDNCSSIRMLASRSACNSRSTFDSKASAAISHANGHAAGAGAEEGRRTTIETPTQLKTRVRNAPSHNQTGRSVA